MGLEGAGTRHPGQLGRGGRDVPRPPEQVGAPQEVYRRPGSEAVARFLGTVTLLEGQAQEDGSLVVAGQRLPLALPATLAGRRVRVALRPEDVEMHEDAAEGTVAGVVKECAYLGHAFRALVGVADGLDVVAYARGALEPGRTVWLRAREGAVIP